MQILLNKEVVAAEIMELARLKISAMLRVPIEAVHARWEHKEGKAPTPAFDVDQSQVKDMKEDDIRQAMGATWRWLKDSLKERLEGLAQHRG